MGSASRLAVLIVGLLLVVDSIAADGICKLGEFFNRTESSCQACSTCPDDQIVRVACFSDRDNICGPFYEFKEFLQELESHTGTTQEPRDVPLVLSNDAMWYDVTMILIGLLCVMSVFLVILLVVVYTLYRRRRRDSVTEKRLENGDFNTSCSNNNNSFIGNDKYGNTELTCADTIVSEKVALVTNNNTVST